MQIRNGFTLMEMMLVLMIIMILMMIPYGNMRYEICAYMECEKMHQFLLRIQSKALFDHEKMIVDVDDHYIQCEDEILSFEYITMNPMSFYFNEAGNISKACTIYCYTKNKTYKVVLQLGSGAIDVQT